MFLNGSIALHKAFSPSLCTRILSLVMSFSGNDRLSLYVLVPDKIYTCITTIKIVEEWI